MKFNSLKTSKAGYSLLEANIAVALCIMTLAGCFAANANFLSVLKSANQSAAASQSVQERVEQMRIANWAQITDSAYLRSNVIGSPTASARSLPDCVETITLSAYPAAALGANTPTQITRTNGQVNVDSTDPTLKNNSMVKAQWTLKWRASGSQTFRFRTATVLIANGGIVK